jgi:hypothetical protein
VIAAVTLWLCIPYLVFLADHPAFSVSPPRIVCALIQSACGPIDPISNTTCNTDIEGGRQAIELSREEIKSKGTDPTIHPTEIEKKSPQ